MRHGLQGPSLSVGALALGLLFVIGGLPLVSRPARAHLRPAEILALGFHPEDPETVVASATWGLVFTRDGGASWRWLCAGAIPFEVELDRPPIVVTRDGSALLGTFAGLVRSDPSLCAWTFPDPALTDVYVIDVIADPGDPGGAYALVTDGGGPDHLYRSGDGGLSWTATGEGVEDVILETVRVAPSDPRRVYVSGADPRLRVEGRRLLVLSSSDGGATFTEAQLPLLDGGEYTVRLLLVDRTDPDRVFARVARTGASEDPERVVLSDDGGETWRTVHRALQVSGMAQDAAGALYLSSVTEGVFRSDDGGETFAPLTTQRTLCMSERSGEVWACVDNLVEGFAIGTLAGAEMNEILRFDQIRELAACPYCSSVTSECPSYRAELANDLRVDPSTLPEIDAGPAQACGDAGTSTLDASAAPLDAGADAGVHAGMDAGAAPPRAAGCGCRAGGSSRAPSPWWPLALFCALVLRARRAAERPLLGS